MRFLQTYITDPTVMWPLNVFNPEVQQFSGEWASLALSWLALDSDILWIYIYIYTKWYDLHVPSKKQITTCHSKKVQEKHMAFHDSSFIDFQHDVMHIFVQSCKHRLCRWPWHHHHHHHHIIHRPTYATSIIHSLYIVCSWLAYAPGTM